MSGNFHGRYKLSEKGFELGKFPVIRSFLRCFQSCFCLNFGAPNQTNKLNFTELFCFFWLPWSSWGHPSSGVVRERDLCVKSVTVCNSPLISRFLLFGFRNRNIFRFDRLALVDLWEVQFHTSLACSRPCFELLPHGKVLLQHWTNKVPSHSLILRFLQQW